MCDALPPHGTYEENLAEVISEMKDMTRSHKFITLATLMWPASEIYQEQMRIVNKLRDLDWIMDLI